MLALTAVLLSTAPNSNAATTEVKPIVGDAIQSKTKIPMCVGCHGLVGYQASFPEVYKVPKISGQNAEYIASALKAYKSGERKHPTMRGIAASLTEQDMADVAAYYSTHGTTTTTGTTKSTLPDVPKPASPSVVALLNKGACISCHGTNFSKPISGSYPKIAGQHPDYLYVALKSYQTEGNPQVGRSNGVMAGIAKQFTKAELKEIAQYIGSLDGQLQVLPQNQIK